MTKQNWYNRTKANAAAGKEPPRTYYCEICKVSCMGALVSYIFVMNYHHMLDIKHMIWTYYIHTVTIF